MTDQGAIVGVAERAPRETLEQVIASFGGADCIRDLEADVQAGWDYLEAQHEVLTERYGDEWIALLRSDVIAHSRDPHKLAALIDATAIDRRRVVVHQMLRRARTLIL